MEVSLRRWMPSSTVRLLLVGMVAALTTRPGQGFGTTNADVGRPAIA